MKLCIIAAVSENGVIGRAGRLPWRLPDEMAHFKSLTTGHPVIMGRRTYESTGPLPHRTNIVVTRDPSFRPKGATPVPSFAAALAEARRVAAANEEVFAIGGTAIFQEALPRADRLYLTTVHAHMAGDTHFPNLNLGRWKLTHEQSHDADSRHPQAFTIRRYDRVSGS